MVTINLPDTTDEKPKKKKKATAKKNTADVELLTGLIVGGSEMVAMMPNASHWTISEEEGRSIATPLSNIIAKNENLRKVMEQSDSISLLIACMTVVAPRVYISYLQMQEKRNLKKKEVKKIDGENRESQSRTNETIGADAAHNEDASNTVLAGLDL